MVLLRSRSVFLMLLFGGLFFGLLIRGRSVADEAAGRAVGRKPASTTTTAATGQFFS